MTNGLKLGGKNWQITMGRRREKKHGNFPLGYLLEGFLRESFAVRIMTDWQIKLEK